MGRLTRLYEWARWLRVGPETALRRSLGTGGESINEGRSTWTGRLAGMGRSRNGVDVSGAGSRGGAGARVGTGADARAGVDTGAGAGEAAGCRAAGCGRDAALSDRGAAVSKRGRGSGADEILLLWRRSSSTCSVLIGEGDRQNLRFGLLA
jgi:hypothetical protein